MPQGSIFSACVPAGGGCPVAVVAAVLIAEGAVWLLRPDERIDPLPVSESSVLHAPASSSAPATSRAASG